MVTNTQSDNLIPHFDIQTKHSYKKYLPVLEMDTKWGFVIQDLGHSIIPEGSDYPTKGHPGSHMFSWETGRVLDEYHFVLISRGSGIFESRSSGKINIQAGDGFLLVPGEWHRYKPNKETGWTELWMGFSGQIVEKVVSEPFFSIKHPVIKSCANLLVMNFFKSMFQLINEQPFGYQRTASGVCLQLLAELCNIQQGSKLNKRNDSILSKAKFLMHKKINENIEFRTFCNNQGISYSKFRSDFKQQTGHAPLQYFLLMKIEKAKDLLNNTELRSKQIAFQLGFRSDHYFSRIFKKKTGLTPQQFRVQKRQITN